MHFKHYLLLQKLLVSSMSHPSFLFLQEMQKNMQDRTALCYLFNAASSHQHPATSLKLLTVSAFSKSSALPVKQCDVFFMCPFFKKLWFLVLASAGCADKRPQQGRQSTDEFRKSFTFMWTWPVQICLSCCSDLTKTALDKNYVYCFSPP